MTKLTYTTPIVEVTEWNKADVITTSLNTSTPYTGDLKDNDSAVTGSMPYGNLQ